MAAAPRPAPREPGRAPGPVAPRPPGAARRRNCSVARTLDIIEDGWSFLILREMFFGVHRFQDFQANLEIPRATLTGRLNRLLAADIVRKKPYSASGKRFAYHFTAKGVALYPVMLALLTWGDDWLGEPGEAPPLALYHKTCGQWFRAQVVCSSCGEPVHARDAQYRDGPGAGWDAPPRLAGNRRSAKPLGRRLGRACSVGRALDVIGDRWTFMVMRETFFGVRRYEDFHTNLGIATNILSDRLGRLVAAGLLRREVYNERPKRYGYRQTEMGADLYGAYLAMIAWGDAWATGDDGLPLVLKHRSCGQDFRPKVVCSCCGEELNAWDVASRHSDS